MHRSKTTMPTSRGTAVPTLPGTAVPTSRRRGLAARLTGLGAAGFAAALLVAPSAHADDSAAPPMDTSSDTGTPTDPGTTPAASSTTPAASAAATGSSSSAGTGSSAPSASAPATSSTPSPSAGSGPGGSGAAKPGPTARTPAPQVQLLPTYGAQKIRVGMQLKDGSYYPPGASLAGVTVHAVETDADGTVVNAGDCPLDQTSATTALCPIPYFASAGDTVVFTQTTAPDGPGILRDPQAVTVGPCVVPAPVLAAAPAGARAAAPAVAPAAVPADLPTCGLGSVPPGSVTAAQAQAQVRAQVRAMPEGGGFGAVPAAIRTDDILGPVVTFIDPGVPPVAKNDAATVTSGHSASVMVLANDVTGGAPTTITKVTAPAHGKVVILGSRVKYTPTAPFGGVDSFTYTITTPNGTSTATVKVTVKAPPVAVDDAAQSSGAAVLIPVLGNDNPEGGVISLAAVTAPGHGTATVEGTAVRYTPAEGFSGTDSFTYTITTANGSATATVTVTVTAPLGTNGLAETGTPSEQLLGAGTVLLLSGGVLLAAGRRRRQHG
jgi:hypothetical protein